MTIRAVIFDIGGMLFHQADRARQCHWEAIFIDDVRENVEAAQAIGMQSIRFESTQQVIDQLDLVLKGSKNVG